MEYDSLIQKIRENPRDEVYIEASHDDFIGICHYFHKKLDSGVMMFFALDERQAGNSFDLYCVFLSQEHKKWVLVKTSTAQDKPYFNSLAKEIYSATLFEREMKEMFGLEPVDNPDSRKLSLHDEVWHEGNYPLRKGFRYSPADKGALQEYAFKRVEGEGIFEVPVGPVHAGIIGPGHFRFSVAGEPIINLEIRLGFTHKGTEKLLEGKSAQDALSIFECISGDSAFAYSLSFTQAVEKIFNIIVPPQAVNLRAIFLELERMYNHVADVGGIALDVGFTYPANLAAIIKENLLMLNKKISGSRYLKNINRIGGVRENLDQEKIRLILVSLEAALNDFGQLKEILLSSISFMDRVDGTGILMKKTAQDLGVVGLAARASGIPLDLRKIFPGAYGPVNFNLVKEEVGDVLARLNLRLREFEESVRLVKELLKMLDAGTEVFTQTFNPKEGFGLGYVEGWRGPVLSWVKFNHAGMIERCKIVDPSFHNWQALSFAVLGNIIPDFPLCNKSFNLSYSGNDL